MHGIRAKQKMTMALARPAVAHSRALVLPGERRRHWAGPKPLGRGPALRMVGRHACQGRCHACSRLRRLQPGPLTFDRWGNRAQRVCMLHCGCHAQSSVKAQRTPLPFGERCGVRALNSPKRGTAEPPGALPRPAQQRQLPRLRGAHGNALRSFKQRAARRTTAYPCMPRVGLDGRCGCRAGQAQRPAGQVAARHTPIRAAPPPKHALPAYKRVTGSSQTHGWCARDGRPARRHAKALR